MERMESERSPADVRSLVHGCCTLGVVALVRRRATSSPIPARPGTRGARSPLRAIDLDRLQVVPVTCARGLKMGNLFPRAIESPWGQDFSAGMHC